MRGSTLIFSLFTLLGISSAQIAGNPSVYSGTSGVIGLTPVPNEIHSSAYSHTTDLATLLGDCPTAMTGPPIPCTVVLDGFSDKTIATEMNVSNSGATVTIGSTTQVVVVKNRGQSLICTGTTGADCIDVAQWGAMICDEKGIGSNQTGCFLQSSMTANITSLITNADHTGAQSQMRFSGYNIVPAATAIVTHASVWLVAVEGQGIFDNLGIGCKAGGIGLSIEDGPSTGDNNTDNFNEINLFGSGLPGCIPGQILSTSTGSGSGQNIAFNGGGDGDALMSPIKLTTNAAITTTGSPQSVNVTVNIPTTGSLTSSNFQTNEQVFVTGSDNHSEYVIVTSFTATSITATFTLTHVSGSTVTTGICADGKTACLLNIDGAAGGTGSHSVRNVTFNNFYFEGLSNNTSGNSFVQIRNCIGCVFENIGFDAGASQLNAFELMFSGATTSTGFVWITAHQHGSLFTNWIQNYIDSLTSPFTQPALGGDSFTYLYPGPPGKNSGLIVDGAVALVETTVSGLPTCSSSTKGWVRAVSDATSPTYNHSLTGGGSVHVPVYCDGSGVWTSH